MKEYLTAILLYAGVIITSVGTEHDVLINVIGGAILGIYNALIQKK